MVLFFFQYFSGIFLIVSCGRTGGHPCGVALSGAIMAWRMDWVAAVRLWLSSDSVDLCAGEEEAACTHDTPFVVWHVYLRHKRCVPVVLRPGAWMTHREIVVLLVLTS